MINIYIAGPLFSEPERAWIAVLAESISLNVESFVFIPHMECKGLNGKSIFDKCIEGLDKSNVIIAIMEGVQVDDGTSFECGYAYAKGKQVIGIRTDFRSAGDTDGTIVNAMLGFSSLKVYRDLEPIIEYLKSIAKD